MARDRSVVTAVRQEIASLPKDLQDSGLAASALTLAKRLQDAGPRDTAAIARELRTTLAELHLIANRVPEENDPVDDILREAAAELSKRT